MIRRFRNKEIEEHRFSAWYKGHEIYIWRDNEEQDWYIQVRPFDKSFCYDGYFHDSSHLPIEDAIEQAISGGRIEKGQKP